MSRLPFSARIALERTRAHYQPDAARLAALRTRVLRASASDQATPEVAEGWPPPARPAVPPGARWAWVLLGTTLGLAGLTAWLVWTASPTALAPPRATGDEGSAPTDVREPEPSVRIARSVPVAGGPSAGVPRSDEILPAPTAHDTTPPVLAPDVPGSVRAPERSLPSARPGLMAEMLDRGQPTARRARDENRRTRPTSTRTSQRTGSGSAPDLAAEVALVSRARRALGEGDYETAAHALAAHRAQHPAGQLHAERLALAGRLACLLGREGEAARAVQALRRLAAPASLVTAVERACALGDGH